MKIISYNVNGIRAAMSKDLAGWLNTQNADVFCIQELKAEENQIDLDPFHKQNYKCYFHSAEKKGYSGVGILSKIAPKHVEYGTRIKEIDSEGRVLRVDFDTHSVMSVYFPSGTSGDERQGFKYEFLDLFYNYIHTLLKSIPNLVICGDINICHKEIDIHNPKSNKNTTGFLPEERAWVSKFIESGFIDTFREFHQEPHRYSWWSYRFNSRANNKGWRIDYQFVTNSMRKNLVNADILDSAVHSDHCPTMLEIKMK